MELEALSDPDFDFSSSLTVLASPSPSLAADFDAPRSDGDEEKDGLTSAFGVGVRNGLPPRKIASFSSSGMTLRVNTFFSFLGDLS